MFFFHIVKTSYEHIALNEITNKVFDELMKQKTDAQQMDQEEEGHNVLTLPLGQHNSQVYEQRTLDSLKNDLKRADHTYLGKYCEKRGTYQSTAGNILGSYQNSQFIRFFPNFRIIGKCYEHE